MTSQYLEDEICRLRRLRLRPEIADVVEEAEEALAAGRELEAEALIEKASALLRLEFKLAS